MARKPSAARLKAENFLRSQIRQGAADGNPRLPTLRIQAKKAGVSLVTMVRAARSLAEQKLITIVAGKGLWINELEHPYKESAHAAAPPPSPHWRKTADTLISRIQTGAYGKGAFLPPISQLAADSGVCHATMRKALEYVCEKKICTRVGKKIQPVHSQEPRSAATIILFTLADSAGKPRVKSQRDHVLISQFEHQCAISSIHLHIYGIPADADRHFFASKIVPRLEKIRQSKRILGYVIRIAYLKFFPDLIDLLPRETTALLDENGSPEIPSLLYRKNLFVYSIAFTRTPGRIVGNYLASLGHTKLAFFAFFPEDDWPHNRLEGLRETFYPQNPNAIHPFLVQKEPFDAFKQKIVPEMAFSGVTIAIPPAEYRERLDALMNRFCINEYTGYYLGKLFREAIKDPAITAWVCDNDRTAVLAHDFLRKEGKRIPEDIALIGFDNEDDSLKYRISTYDFNTPITVRSIINLLLEPRLTPSGLQGTSRREFEIAGTILERESTRPLRVQSVERKSEDEIENSA